jgi:NO-binding membrane sensor protein with MHYT domain
MASAIEEERGGGRGEFPMPVTHERWLVALSLLVAIQGAYVGLSLAVQVASNTGLRRRLLLAGAAFSLALAVWSMHFVGMLAARLPFPVDYLVLPTLLSFLVCVIVVGGAVLLIGTGPLTLARLAMSACLMGGGIFSMHYIGMAALHASAHMVHAPFHVAASMAVAIAASGLALWLAAGRSGGLPLALSATAFGLAISGMHYTAMAGLTLHLGRSPRSRTSQPRTVTACLRRGFSRSAAPADRRAGSRTSFRSSATGSRTSSRSTISWRCTPTRTTPTSSTAPPSCSVRCRSATSSSGSTGSASRASTAATSSTSTASSG